MIREIFTHNSLVQLGDIKKRKRSRAICQNKSIFTTKFLPSQNCGIFIILFSKHHYNRFREPQQKNKIYMISIQFSVPCFRERVNRQVVYAQLVISSLNWSKIQSKLSQLIFSTSWKYCMDL